MQKCIKSPNTRHAFPIIHTRQILLELFAYIEVHVVVFEGAEGFDDYVVPVMGDVLVRLQQSGDFPDGNIYICNRSPRKVQNKQERRTTRSRKFKWIDTVSDTYIYVIIVLIQCEI